ncbi:MAG: radical SAM protein [Polyangiaceae bacterium]
MDVTFVLTHDCNLGCSYCYAGKKFRKSMSPEVRDQALALAFAGLRSGSKLSLCYFGGEPTLEWELLVDTARKARDLAGAKGIALQQSVTTNGTTLTDARVAQLGELGVYIALSIDGNREAHERERPMMGGKSSFDEVFRGLSCLLRAGRSFDTISVVTPTNAHLLGESVQYLLGLGVPRMGLNIAYEGDWTPAALEHLTQGLAGAAMTVAGHFRNGRVCSVTALESKIRARLKGGMRKEDTCPIGDGTIAVAPSGNIYPCERLVGEDDSTAYVIGHVATGVVDVQMRKHRDAMPDHHATNDECHDCGERGRCSAFCACANLAETGHISVAGGVQCFYERATMEVADALLHVMALEKNAVFAEWFSLDFSKPLPDASLPKAPPARIEAREGERKPHRLHVLR